MFDLSEGQLHHFEIVKVVIFNEVCDGNDSHVVRMELVMEPWDFWLVHVDFFNGGHCQTGCWIGYPCTDSAA